MRTPSRLPLLLLSACLSLALCSCVSLVPERFEANLRFLATYGYVEYNFKGNVLVAEAALDVQNKKITQAETDKMLKEIEQTILDDDKNAMGDRQFRSLRYIGNNRFAADQQVKASFVEDLTFFQSDQSPFFVEIIEENMPEDSKYVGEYSIHAFLVDDNMVEKMKSLKVSQRGTFTLETDCRVISHNAHTVGRNGRNYVYTWKIDGKPNRPATLTLRAQQPRLTRW